MEGNCCFRKSSVKASWSYLSASATMLLPLLLSNIYDIPVQPLAEYPGREWFTDMLPRFSTHAHSHLGITNQSSHGQRELSWHGVAEETRHPIFDRLDWPPTVAPNDWFVGCHCLQRNNAEVLILHESKNNL